MRRTTAVVVMAAVAFTAACSANDTGSGHYWDGYHIGYAEASRYAKETGETELGVCTQTPSPGWSHDQLCSTPWDRAYPASAGERFCDDHMPDGLSEQQRAVWHKGCFAGITFDDPDTVKYGPDPSSDPTTE
ncbi:hypothetical protein [Streptomyces sp. NPDC094468]|uniref:hypothetical protein n=1 Tax=Streptomyces sp. NPDC094468 TaxID=3366066 RepID=UPI00382B6DE5